MRTFSMLFQTCSRTFPEKNQLVIRNVHVWVYFELVLLDYLHGLQSNRW